MSPSTIATRAKPGRVPRAQAVSYAAPTPGLVGRAARPLAAWWARRYGKGSVRTAGDDPCGSVELVGASCAQVTSAIRIGGLWMWVMVASRPTTSLAISSASWQGGGGPEAEAAHGPGVASDDDHPAEVLQGVGSPVPHVEGMHTVVGVARAVQVAVPLVLGEAPFVGPLDLVGIGGLGEHLLEEVDVAGVVDRMELPRRGVAHDQHATLADQGLAAVEVEEVPETEAHHEDRGS